MVNDVVGKSYLQNHASQKVVQHTNGVLPLVIGRNGNVQVRQWAVGITECDRGDVDVAGLLQSPPIYFIAHPIHACMHALAAGHCIYYETPCSIHCTSISSDLALIGW